MLSFPHASAPVPGRPGFSPWRRGPGAGAGRVARAAVLAFSLLLLSLPARSQQATPDTEVGDTVQHPVTGEQATVVQLVPGTGVITDKGDLILVHVMQGEVITPDDPDTPDDEEVTIESVTLNDDTGLVEAITLSTGEVLQVATSFSSELSDAEADAQGTPGTSPGLLPFTPPAGNTRPFSRPYTGGNGGKGDNGWGLEICDPTGIFGGCTIIGEDAERGGDGGTHLPVTETIDATWGDIQTVTDGLPGIQVLSIGGNGGRGGDAAGNFDAARGGNAGRGGDLTVNAHVEVTTSGQEAHGIFAQSRAGLAGHGGTGYLFSTGGDGGTAAAGGRVTVFQDGAIGTSGAGSHGIYAISMGGAAGAGGDSWGIVGDGGSSSAGGNGGPVSVTNAGTILTIGNDSHGILAQSIGGEGGDGGDAGGLVALGGGGSAGGSGGSVRVTNQAGASIETRGDRSIGVLAQSIGGGGGNGGTGGGIAAFGGTGSAGGSASLVEVINQGGSSIVTQGQGSHGVLAQSIGGGGGTGAAAGGLVAIGAGGGSAGNGGTVIVDSDSDISTSGSDARGLFAQSIGGGGGTSSGVGGAVAIGGKAGSGGNGSTVTVGNGGAIVTQGSGADAIFAQSIGGGGGSAGSAFGAVSIGGGGAAGGSAGNVTAGNSGTLQTSGAFARGIFAQSVGGGGGSAGSTGGAVSIGGSGALGGNGARVDVDNSGQIVTDGFGASAIFAQSIGGGGGSGGTASGAVSIGGGGSLGGSAGIVDVDNGGAIETGGDFARGIFAQSIGGGGGSGGYGGGLVAVGGSGAVARSGNEVHVDNSGRIRTAGLGASAIFAQSIGGGGGDGASSGGAFLSIGGGGGGGGASETVSVSSSGDLITQGHDAHGIFAQSVGGGGGNGGNATSVSAFFGVAIGGSGAGGGNGGDVEVTTSSRTVLIDGVATDVNPLVRTSGDRSHGIYAQSIGGGGGNGGFAVQATVGTFVSASVAIGGSGDGGGAGGDVSVGATTADPDAVAVASILTDGADSFGVLAQSVGGGGGNGGYSFAGALQLNPIGGGAIAVGVGGSGGGGGAGGLVDLDFAGSVQTGGDRSTGVLAQSLGGGGGNGGFNVSTPVSVSGIGDGSIGVGVGGSGAGGGNGGRVEADFDGTVITAGNAAVGVHYQSAGGGGGNGGFNITTGASGAGIGSGAITVGVGGSGAGGGTGGVVDGSVTGLVQTAGARSGAVIMQSVGGGGGNGGFDVSVAAGAAGIGSGSIAVGLGGSGGSGGAGGAVIADMDADLSTAGAESDGVLIQSVGGGGGNGGFDITSPLNAAGIGNGAVGVSVGGSGAVGGNGGSIDAILAGSVHTQGARADGVIAQSVGGGGGNGGFAINGTGAGAGIGSGSVAVGVGGSGAGGGNGGRVDASFDGGVLTEGQDASGLLFQSIGGGGGNGGFSVTAALNGAGIGNGAVTVGIGGSGAGGGTGGEVDGTVTHGLFGTLGARSGAIVLQSVGGGGGNGGFDVNVAAAGAGIGSGSIGVGLGGSGGSGGDGGKVTGLLTAEVSTAGADSDGVLVQSVGGGGGNGGFDVTVPLNGAGIGNGAIGVSLGGSGGAAGAGGEVTGTFTGAIHTAGDRSEGMVVQSLGGGGGNGGFSVNGTGAGAGIGSGSVAVGIGGAGGAGGNAGAVTASLVGSVTTEGHDAIGALFQSLGGGGGNGGFAVNASVNGAGVGNGAVGVSVGGSGAAGGDGTAVDGTVNAAVATAGDRSAGVVMQSLGGGGGNGGFNVTLAGAGSGVGTGAVAVGVGGAGGAGGTAGSVLADVDGSVVTRGVDADAVLLQSVGGGGGNGGFNVTLAGAGAGVGSGSVSVGIGGSAGDGGPGGSIEAQVNADIHTLGDRSGGVIAQSIGGGGGNGGFDVSISGSGAGVGNGAVGVGVGGFGGKGGDAAAVKASYAGKTATEGRDATAILFQSVGGGGGDGGFNVGIAGSGAGTGSGALNVGVGGFGGEAGLAGTVNGSVSGTVVTLGDRSDGVVMQSVGGGGGNGGFDVSLAGSGAGVGSGSVAVGVGGFGAGGGDGNTVTATMDAAVMTAGFDADGVLIQSVGGGGGNGGFDVSVAGSGAGTGSGSGAVSVGGFGGAASHGAAVQATLAGTVVTEGDASAGITVQSVGGGGGSGGFAVAAGISGAGTGSGGVGVGVGGSGGDGGNGGTVEASFTGDTQTSGDDALGIVFQSVGGGGGSGGFSVAGGISGAGTGSGGVGVGVGGFGGQGGRSGDVLGSVTGDVLTDGTGSGGILVQSVGGGGGQGGLTVTAGFSGAGTGSGAVGVGVGGFGGGGGTAGDVTSTVTGDVVARGADSDAIVVQSVGGGGGNGGLSVAGGLSGAGNGSGAVAVGVGGFGGDGGTAGDVSSTLAGNIVTLGDGSGGVVAQSVGGGGGNGGLNVSGTVSLAKSGSGAVGIGVGGFGGTGGAAATVTSGVTGDVLTQGNDAIGILAQSLGGGGGNGGLNVSGAVSASNSGSGAVALGVGGFGGTGGLAAAVVSDATGNVVTLGDGSHAFVAQSIGGGGGNGGLNVAGAVSLAKSSGGAVALGVGGFGGGAGDAGDVSSTLVGQVETHGAGATGILLQSLGGGGGNGGLNVSGGLNLSLQGTGAGVALGVGGFGGGGGTAGDVRLAHTGDVLTEGASSGGITAQSLGGGGGNGALNVSAGLAATNSSNAIAVGLGVGGFGGTGGTAGEVSVSVDGSVVASGMGGDETVVVPAVFDGEEELVPATVRRVRAGGSHGVLAQSIGGSGGNGGIDVAAGIAVGAPGSGKSYGASLGVGGFGGGGGDAGSVAVLVDGDVVQAQGDDASGIAAQSIGGGGGNGGLNVSGGISLDGTVALGVGGFGGDGGAGGDVLVTSDTVIQTAGASSSGILAQSIGGGGGNGAINVSGAITPQTKSQGKAVSLVFGVGGFGGAADAAGNVAVSHRGAIGTAGADAHGILAQSIGGGGGNGGLNVAANASGNSRLAFAGGIGGHGGAGADAGEVSVVSDGNIVTSGAFAEQDDAFALGTSSGSGILAQSIGGGGGTGGMNVSGVFALKGSPVAFGMGGFGAGGGDAGSVSVIHGIDGGQTLIATSGSDSAGIMAQSIGGGGGNGGGNFLGSVTLGAGGAGGGTGTGIPDANRCDGWDERLVTDNCVNWDKVIAELDKRKASKGGKSTVAVQIAIGGRGGEAGNAGAASVEHFGNILTAGDRSEGIVAQSIGGGGGNAGVNIGMAYAGGGVGVNLAVGGAPGDGGTGSTVTVRHTGDITTSGVDSAGIFAQSIGGGGGDVATNLVRGTTTGGTISVTLGRIGGTGGAGGDVTVASDGIVTTLGDRSVGLYAQSVGNGGGKSGSSSIALGRDGKNPKKKNPVGLTLALGLEGGAGGTAGDVSVTAQGRVQTQGVASHAVFAQSVGGGGGASVLEMGSEVTSSNLVLTQGGEGGSGGTSGFVAVENAAELVTLGAQAKGIFAQSIGGGGGASEMSVDGGWESGAGGAVIALGGSGGTGAVSGGVNVGNAGLVSTQGDGATGIHAQSIGGGGGDSSLEFSGQVTAEKSGKIGLSVAVGGDGGSGADAGEARVANGGRIATAGEEASGIVAQSIGGGGGNSDLEAELTLEDESGSTQLGFTLGGTGGTGGTGGDVTVTNDEGGIVTTEGASSHGIFAQSIGGGGGNGTSKLSAGIASGSQGFGLGFGIGGSGGSGGIGGDVTVDNAGVIETLGNGSHGVFAQSIGGGGGNGEMHLVANIDLSSLPSATGVTPILGIGGFGGDGNDAGDVSVSNDGTIVTHGVASHAIVAQSIGGGGGNATFAIGAALTLGLPETGFEPDPLTDPASAELGISAPLLNRLGGTAGAGGQGGQVTVVHTGDIVLFGEDSQAIVAQSVNGGGGSIRFGLTGVTDLTDEAGIYLALGAEDTQDSDASRVSVTSTGNVVMMADDSVGHALQSIGGGGGLLDFDLDLSQLAAPADLPVEVVLGGTGGQRNAGGDIAAGHSGDIGSLGESSHAMLVQSIGGGGGRASVDIVPGGSGSPELALTLGGTGGTAENGGAIALARSGTVATAGDRAFGTVIQSLGGGGGVLTAAVGGGEATPGESAAAVAAAPAASKVRSAPAAAGGAGLTLGAAGGTGLDGGDLDLALAGDVATAGRQAHGLFFQSIGAGGGLALVSGSDASFTIGGSGGASGDGGDITLTNDGDVSTAGFMAHGVFLQSIGGGGGAAFTGDGDLVLDVSQSAANAGDGGDIAFTQNGDIQATGEAAFGIFAQSLGGGGGIIDGVFAGTAGGDGSGGAIDIGLTGSVLAPGDGGIGIFAQSEGAGGAGNITIDIGPAHSVAGGAGGIAIEIRGGADNSITNRGFLGTVDGVAGSAMIADGDDSAGNDALYNFGTVAGSVLLGDGENLLRNESDAVFVMGSTVDLTGDAAGSHGTLVNLGTLDPGGSGALLDVAVDGDFEQGSGALIFSDYDLSRRGAGVQADRLGITGSAIVDGTVELNLLNPGFVMPGHYEDALLSAAGGIRGAGGDPGLELTGMPESIVADFGLAYPNGTDVVLATDIDFAPDGLNGNQAALGDYVNRLQLAGGSRSFAPLAADLFFTETLGDLQGTYDELSPVVHAESLAHSLLSSARFGDRLMECRERDGEFRFAEEGSCRWFRFGHRSLDRDASADHFAWELDGLELSLGVQGEIAPGRHLGFGASFSRSDSQTGDSARGEADLAQVGLVLKQRVGDLMLSGAISGGHGWFETSRWVSVAGVLSGRAGSSPGIDFVAAHGRITHDLVGDSWYLRSIMDAGLNRLHMDAFTETGLAVVGVRVSEQNRTYVSLRPALELGAELRMASGLLLRPYGRAGLLYFGSGPSPSVQASFDGAPPGVAPFTVTGGMERFFSDVALGLDVLSTDGSVLRLEGDGQFGSETRAWGIEINWTLGFE